MMSRYMRIDLIIRKWFRTLREKLRVYGETMGAFFGEPLILLARVRLNTHPYLGLQKNGLADLAICEPVL
jgi:hypothetical protein